MAPAESKGNANASTVKVEIVVQIESKEINHPRRTRSATKLLEKATSNPIDTKMKVIKKVVGEDASA